MSEIIFCFLWLYKNPKFIMVIAGSLVNKKFYKKIIAKFIDF